MGEPSQPHTFGTYTVERELGRGGMGVVYAATHDVLGRRAAVKVLLGEVSRDREQVDRFINEARAASAIEHPGIVQVYEIGQTGDTVYIVMELLQGESLASRLKARGAMPIATAIGLARQCANALEAAHRAGIVHRDLKPDNVFLVRDAEVAGGERVKLLDFGVAKLVGGDASTTVARTVTGAILGTPHYMSPEQCEGAREVDHRSDLYSLGCMVFQMVTGRLPFNSPGIGGLIGMHLHVAPPRLRSLRPDAPEELETLVSRLLAKPPDERVQTATEVATLLAEVPADAATSARTRPATLPVPLEVAPVDPAMPTVVTMAQPPADLATPVPTDRARVEKRRERRRLWIGIGIAAAAVAGVVVFAIARGTETTQTPYPLREPVVGPTPPAPRPAPAVDHDLAEARQRFEKRDLDGAYARTLIVLKRSPEDPDATKLHDEIRRARALVAYDAMREPGQKPDEIKRQLDVVYANTEPDSPLRGEADRVWAKAKPAPKKQAATPQQPRPVPSEQPTIAQVVQDKKAKRTAEILKLIRATTQPVLLSTHCFELAYLDRTVVPWEKCVAAHCQISWTTVENLIALADPHDRQQLRALCPKPKL
jgi:serine/threonine-protein kinase